MTRFFTRLFSQLFNFSYFRNVYQLKLYTITNICPPNETLLRMLSLNFLDKVAKRVDFYSTTILLLDFFDKDRTSLNITRLYSTHSTRWPSGSIFPSIFFPSKKSSEKWSCLAWALEGHAVYFLPFIHKAVDLERNTYMALMDFQ